MGRRPLGSRPATTGWRVCGVGRGAATRTVGLLGTIFAYAVRHRMWPDNPVHGVMRFADGRRERCLSEEEYGARTGRRPCALRKVEVDGMWPAAIAAVRFLARTGWRSREASGLRWGEIDLTRRTARLSDTKTGLSRAARCRALPSVNRFARVS